jgi:hypothetical protein
MDRPERQWGGSLSGEGDLSLTGQTTLPLGHLIRSWPGSDWRGMASICMPLAWRIDGCTCESSIIAVLHLQLLMTRMTLTFVDFNGIVPEKFNAVELSHTIDAE